jgi:hypothetical protein
MKTKALLFVGAAALVTLSFTFASTTPRQAQNKQSNIVSEQAAPVGGFAAEEVSK